MSKRMIPVDERLPFLQTLPLSLQHLFAMFGATVLVPILFKVDPATILLFNGIGTLLYLFICKGKIPAYLGSSFAFISPVFVVLPQFGYGSVLGGFFAAGLVFTLVALLIRLVGIRWIDIVFPPAALVVVAEHIGHLVVTGNIVGKDLTKDPGLDRSLLGNGLSTMLSSLFGSTPNTTYGENIGVLAITKVYSTWVMGGAAILAIILSFIGKLSAAIQSIPVPVMGGVSLLLFGVIAASGVRMLVESKVDYSRARNLILTSLVLIIGISGASLQFGSINLKGMALATVVAIVASLAFKIFDQLGWSNDSEIEE